MSNKEQIDLNLKAVEKRLDVFRMAQVDFENYRKYFNGLDEDGGYGHIHPMLRVVENYIDSIYYNYDENEDEIKKLLKKGEKILADYLAGNYYDTVASMLVEYSREVDGRVVEGVSFRIQRDGVTLSDKKLRGEIEKIISTVNPRQTDEWYLLNIGQKLPPKLDNGFELSNYAIADMLADWMKN